MQRSTSLLALSLLLLLPPLTRAARKAVLEKAGAPSWYGAYLLPEEHGGENLATLRRGLEVEVVHLGSRRHKVRLPALPHPEVIVHAAGWPGAAPAEGWISPRFLRLLDPEPAPTVPRPRPRPEPPDAEEEEEGGGGLFGWGWGRSDDEDPALEEDPAASEGEGEEPGAEPWREELPSLYYVFADAGQDGAYFTVLAGGRTSLVAYDDQRRRQNYPNHIERMIREDIERVGRADTRVVRVRATGYQQVLDAMARGLRPPGEVDRHEVHSHDELVPGPANIAGFCTISHASTDGPIIGGEGAGVRRQLTDSFFERDSRQGSESLDHRLVKGARISFFGCNTGNCQYYLDHSSIAHLLAGRYHRKQVIVRGKRGIGSPNSSPSAYAPFGLDGQEIPVRLDPAKKEYLFYVPLKDSSNPDSGRKWVYESLQIPYSSEQEKQAILDYYRQRGVNVRVEDGRVVARAPRIARVPRSSKKDPLLLEVVRSLGARDELSLWDRFLRRIGRLEDSEEIARVRAMMPELRKLLDDRELFDIIETVEEENGGTLDEHDFRIWFRIYFQKYDNKNDRVSIAYRACLCDDPELKVQ